MTRNFLQKHYHIVISVHDCLYWTAASLIFTFLPLEAPCPLPLLFFLMFLMVVGRETMAVVLEYVLFRSYPAFSMMLCRLIYALAIVYFFLFAIRFAGIGLLACFLLPALLCLIFFPAIFYRKNHYAAAPADRVHNVFEKFCTLHKKSGIEIYLSPDVEKNIFSDYFPHPAIVYSPDLNTLPEPEILFLIAHETAHIEKKHFIKNRIVESLLLVVHSFLPFLFLGMIKPLFFSAGHWMPPHYAAIPLIMMTALNYPCVYLLRRYHLFLENQADLYGVNIVQNVEYAEKSLLYLAGENTVAEAKENIAFEASVNERTALLRKRHPQPAAGEKEDFQSYLCLTYRCNSKCVFCASDLTGDQAYIPLENVKIFIDTDQCKNSRLVLSGGEPMLHPDFYSILQYARNKYQEICLMTNGTLLDSKEKMEQIAETVTNIAIPLYGASAATHDAITRHKGSFDKTLKCINLLKNSPVKLELKLLWSKLTMEENFRIVEMIENKMIFPPDNLSLTNIIIGEKAFASYSQLMADSAEDIARLNKLILKMSQWNFSLQNIPLCLLTEEVRNVVLSKEKAVPPVIRLYYLSPDSKAEFISHIPEEWDKCKMCSLFARCTRRYPGQKAYTENIHSLH